MVDVFDFFMTILFKMRPYENADSRDNTLECCRFLMLFMIIGLKSDILKYEVPIDNTLECCRFSIFFSDDFY